MNDVTFIGVSDEPLQTVVNFLFKKDRNDDKLHNDRTGYTLTTDPDESRTTASSGSSIVIGWPIHSTF